MLKIQWEGGINPFNYIVCPICGKNEFTSLSASDVWCDECNARFNVRCTGGDNGCVIDCTFEHLHAPSYHCPDCDPAGNRGVAGLWAYPVFDHGRKICRCGTKYVQRDGFSHSCGAIAMAMEPTVERFCIVLKTGEGIYNWSPVFKGTDESHRKTLRAKVYGEELADEETWFAWVKKNREPLNKFALSSAGKK